MTDHDWYPGADRSQDFSDDPRWHVGPVAAPGCGMKFVPHTTEGSTMPGYGGGASAPHVTIEADFANERAVIYQHFPFSRYARALKTGPGLRINDGGALQAEFIGTNGWASTLNPDAPYTAEPYVPGLPMWFWRDVARFLAWLHVHHGVALEHVAHIFAPYGTPSTRLTYEEWVLFSGVVGHLHVPVNDHTDPGGIPVGLLIALARLFVAGEEPTMAEHPISSLVALEAELLSRGFTIYCGPSYARRGLCFFSETPGVGHGHRRDSTHFLRGGGAIDVGFDRGGPISDWEKAHLDALARELIARGYRVIWGKGVTGHEDHLHVDCNTEGPGSGHQVNYFNIGGITLYPRAFPNALPDFNAGFTLDQIKAAQVLLKALGLYSGAIDGLRGDDTQAAIRAFQKLVGLDPDAQPGENTMAALEEVAALNAGFTLAWIRAVQRYLTTLGYYTGAIDGIRGPGTQKAVAAFQTKAKLEPVDGQPGKATRAALKAAVDALTAPEPAPAPAPEPAPQPAPEPAPAPTPEPVASLAERVAPFRLAGRDAYATAFALGDFEAPTGKGIIFVARDSEGELVADSLAAAVVAARVGALAVPLPGHRGGVPSSLRDELVEHPPAWVRFAGDASSISDATAAAALDAAGITY